VTLALLAGISNLGREVVKGIADVEGDRFRNLRTVALTRGERWIIAMIGFGLPNSSPSAPSAIRSDFIGLECCAD
jgi:4-hydroxybenzoate polyprenyltransferase